MKTESFQCTRSLGKRIPMIKVLEETSHRTKKTTKRIMRKSTVSNCMILHWGSYSCWTVYMSVRLSRISFSSSKISQIHLFSSNHLWNLMELILLQFFRLIVGPWEHYWARKTQSTFRMSSPFSTWIKYTRQGLNPSISIEQQLTEHWRQIKWEQCL